MPDRRLEAEALRDAMLFAAGTLELERPVGSPAGVLEGRPRREEMIQQLAEGQEIVIRTAREIFPAADEANDEPTADLLIQRMQVHEKTAWMLRSMLA